MLATLTGQDTHSAFLVLSPKEYQGKPDFDSRKREHSRIRHMKWTKWTPALYRYGNLLLQQLSPQLQSRGSQLLPNKIREAMLQGHASQKILERLAILHFIAVKVSAGNEKDTAVLLDQHHFSVCLNVTPCRLRLRFRRRKMMP